MHFGDAVLERYETSSLKQVVRPHRKHPQTANEPGEAVESTLRMLKSGGTCSAFRSPWTTGAKNWGQWQSRQVESLSQLRNHYATATLHLFHHTKVAFSCDFNEYYI